MTPMPDAADEVVGLKAKLADANETIMQLRAEVEVLRIEVFILATQNEQSKPR